MAGPIRKVGPFTQTTGVELPDKQMWRGLGREYYAAPGSTQHHDRVLQRERMGQKKTPKGDVRNKRK